MEKPTFAPAYVAYYPRLAEIARDNGYSLAVHGSIGRNAWSDLDLVAVPWSDKATTADILIAHLSMALIGYSNTNLVDAMKGLEAESKPHGRLAYRVSLGAGACIDISVMPLVKEN